MKVTAALNISFYSLSCLNKGILRCIITVKRSSSLQQTENMQKQMINTRFPGTLSNHPCLLCLRLLWSRISSIIRCALTLTHTGATLLPAAPRLSLFIWLTHCIICMYTQLFHVNLSKKQLVPLWKKNTCQ